MLYSIIINTDIEFFLLLTFYLFAVFYLYFHESSHLSIVKLFSEFLNLYDAVFDILLVLLYAIYVINWISLELGFLVSLSVVFTHQSDIQL